MTAVAFETLGVATSPVESQADLAVALGGILRRTDLPLLVWTVYPSGLVGRAFGDSDQATTRMVKRWALAFSTVAVTECVPSLESLEYAWGRGWHLEPGRVTARLSADVSVFGELIELPGGVR